MSSDPSAPQDDPFAGAGEPGQMTEEEMRAAYEQELSRLTTSDLALQAAVSLLNLGGRRLGLPAGPGQEPAEGERDLEQVRDAIDGVRALLEILERRRPSELRPLRDALSQLQMAYAREAGGAAQASQPAPAQQPPGAQRDAPPAPAGDQPVADEGEPAPGPAESSGRLWVPGR